MSENLTVTLTLSDWELETFRGLCEEYGCFLGDALEGFVKWCAEDSERATEWLTEEMV